MDSKDNDIELLGSSSTNSVENSSLKQVDNTVPVPEVPTGMNAVSTSNTLPPQGVNSIPAGSSSQISNASDAVLPTVENSPSAPGVGQEGNVSFEKTNYISPYAAKPYVAGTSATSPRISPDSTFAQTNHSTNVAPIPKGAEKKSNSVGISSTNIGGEVESNKGKSVKPVVLLIAFIIILAAVFLLPYASEFLGKIFTNNQQEEVPNQISSGDLVCMVERENGENSYQYTETYNFTNGKVTTLEHEVLMQGDADALNDRYNECQLLQSNANMLTGVNIDCNLSSDQMVETQFFNLANFDVEQLTPGFSEAGGVYPNAQNGDSYEEVQRTMEMSGYQCEVR